MSFVIAFLNHDNPVHNRLLKACVVLFILDSILLTAFLFTAPSLDPPLILAGLVRVARKVLRRHNPAAV